MSRALAQSTASPRGEISPEYALLLKAASPGSTNGVGRPDWESARWDRTLRLAAWHRVLPLLFRYLEPDGAPPEALATLRHAYLANAARYLLISGTLRRTLDTLADSGVPAMLLKGAALTETVYPDPALRQMSDLDILVPEDQLDVANRVLGAIGYSRATEVRRPRDTAAWMREHHLHDPALIDAEERIAVELHRHIAYDGSRAHFDIADVWRRSRTSNGKHRRLVPATEDLVLQACLHFTHDRAKRSYGSLAQLCDIAWILDREPMDWSMLTASARAYRVHGSVFLCLFAARELGLPIPPEPLEDLRPASFDDRLGRRVVSLRVLRTEPPLPVRSLRRVLATDRVGLAESWGAEADRPLSLVAAYVRRGFAGLLLARHAFKEPWTVFTDFRLNSQIAALQSRSRESG